MTQTSVLKQKLSDLKASLAETLIAIRNNPSPERRHLKEELQNAIADTAEALYKQEHANLA
jgi:hypothetical protein